MDQKMHPESFAVNDVHTKSLPPLKMVAVPFPHKAVFICRFCGGKKCKHEDWRTNSKSAIKGLNSNWITPSILATQRPSSRIIKEYGIIDEFLKNNILSIYNLEEPGEHPFCGDGILHQSGFSYLPEDFYKNGIYFYNFGWKDMTSTSVDAILKILKQMALSFKDGKKVAVHCHAGRGRTGMIIVAWLIFCEHYSAKDAIALFMSRRAKSLTKKSQKTVLYSLEKTLNDAKFMFFKTPKYSVQDYLNIQKKMLLIELSDNVEETFSLCKEPNLFSKNGKMLHQFFTTFYEVITSIYDLKTTNPDKKEWSTYEEELITEVLKGRINQGHLELSEITDPRILTQLLLDFFDGVTRPILNFKALSEIQAFIEKQENFRDFIQSERITSFHASEFCILERLVRFLAEIIRTETAADEELLKALTRLSISLLMLRKKLDNMFVQRNLLISTSKDPVVEAVAKFLNLWIKGYQKTDVELFNSNRGPIRINYEKLNTLISSKPQDSEVKTNHNGTGLPKIEQVKKDEEQKANESVTNSTQNTSTQKTSSPQKRAPSPFNFSKLPGSNPDVSERLSKRQELLDQKISNNEARIHFDGLVEGFMDMSSSLQEMVLEQLKEIKKVSKNIE